MLRPIWNVFDSIKAVLVELKKQGYDVGDAPMDKEEIVGSILDDPKAKISSPELNVAYRMSTDEYYELTPYATELEENWGPAPGNLNSAGQNLIVYEKQFGNVFIGVQPSFGYEGDPCASCLPSQRVPTRVSRRNTRTWRRFSKPMLSCTLEPTAVANSCLASKSEFRAPAIRIDSFPLRTSMPPTTRPRQPLPSVDPTLPQFRT